MKLRASFAYNPVYFVEVSFTITLEKCSTTVITSAPQADLYYSVGSGLSTYALAVWTNTYGALCNQF